MIGFVGKANKKFDYNLLMPLSRRYYVRVEQIQDGDIGHDHNDKKMDKMSQEELADDCWERMKTLPVNHIDVMMKQF